MVKEWQMPKAYEIFIQNYLVSKQTSIFNSLLIDSGSLTRNGYHTQNSLKFLELIMLRAIQQLIQI